MKRKKRARHVSRLLFLCPFLFMCRENGEYMSYKIEKHLNTISSKGAITLELNIISYNGDPAKLDLRRWYNGQMLKGITLTEAEARELALAIADYFKRKQNCATT